jgi:hypothetical protein
LKRRLPLPDIIVEPVCNEVNGVPPNTKFDCDVAFDAVILYCTAPLTNACENNSVKDVVGLLTMMLHFLI